MCVLQQKHVLSAYIQLRHLYYGRTLLQRISESKHFYPSLLCPTPKAGGIKRRCASDVCLSVAYIGPKSRTERPRKTKIGTEVAHVTRDSDTTFNFSRSKGQLAGGGGILWRPPAQLVIIKQNVFHMYVNSG